VVDTVFTLFASVYETVLVYSLRAIICTQAGDSYFLAFDPSMVCAALRAPDPC
jgi:hypothetical protein